MRSPAKRDSRVARRIFFLGLAPLLAAATVTAVAQTQQASPAQTGVSQQPASPQQGAPPIVVRTPVVIVPVTVKDSRGQLVGDLNADDFRILADNVEQKVASFSAEAVPLSVVVLIDNDLEQRKYSRVQKSLTAICAGFSPNDEAALVAYDEFPEVISDFSSNNDALFTKLKRLELDSHSQVVIADPTTRGPIGAGAGSGPEQANGQPLGSGPPPEATVQPHGIGAYKNVNALDDAIFAAAEMLKSRGRDRRKIIFLISDETDSGTNAHGFDETLRSLLVSDVSLFSISVSRTAPVGKKLFQKGALNLEKYAANTGGDTYYAGNQADLERLYSEVTEQARNEYTLTFSPQEVAKGQDFHPIEVRVKRPDLNVESRDGYYESAITPGH
jgi:VWFA-related protein